MSKKVWTEIDCWTGLAIRVFKNQKLMAMAMPYAEDGCTKQMDRAEAVRQIRQQMFSIQEGRCADCNAIIYWENMELHERQHRGEFAKEDKEDRLGVEKSGEVSLQNSVALCWECHQVFAHGDREVKFGAR